MLMVAAKTFETIARPGSEGRTLLGNEAEKICGPIKSTFLLIDDGGERVALLTSHFMSHYYRVSNILRRRVAEELGIDRSRVLVFSSHNHCTVKLIRTQYSFGCDDHDLELPESELTPEGMDLLNSYLQQARELPAKLQPAELRYGVDHERRISHNRKGRRADGSAYFMREEDRRLLGQDFNGDIDDDAFVLGFFNQENKPICFLTQFTAHPVTAFHCDHPVVHGEYPQVACDDLSEAYGGVPVAFLQGCAGDVNSKGLLSTKSAEESIRDAERYGHFLGETFIETSRSLTASQRNDLGLAWTWAELPFKEVPPLAELQERLEAANAFLARCEAGDSETTKWCDGLNFPSNMSLPYRKALIEPVKRWLEWVISFHKENRLHEAPRNVKLHMAAIRLGDVGLVGMPCEPLLGIGRQIKRESNLPMTIPCGYMNDTSVAYVPDGPNCDDSEYMSQFCRYTTTLLPYQRPAGDLLAESGVEMLADLSTSAPI